MRYSNFAMYRRLWYPANCSNILLVERESRQYYHTLILETANLPLDFRALFQNPIHQFPAVAADLSALVFSIFSSLSGFDLPCAPFLYPVNTVPVIALIRSSRRIMVSQYPSLASPSPVKPTSFATTCSQFFRLLSWDRWRLSMLSLWALLLRLQTVTGRPYQEKDCCHHNHEHGSYSKRGNVRLIVHFTLSVHDFLSIRFVKGRYVTYNLLPRLQMLIGKLPPTIHETAETNQCCRSSAARLLDVRVFTDP